MKHVANIFGWLGVLAILAAYALITFEAVTATDILYNSLNAFGALGIIWSSFYKEDMQPIALNIVWLLIAIFGVTQSL